MSNRYKGGVISATPPTTTGGESGTASGAWTLEQQMQLQAAGLWPSQPPPPYIEDVFSTYLYTGNGATQTITNNINLSGKGGLVWIKNRLTTGYHNLWDTARGNAYLMSNDTGASQALPSGGLTSFGTTGFQVTQYSTSDWFNKTSDSYASWTFREKPKFFDIVTYTGTGSNTTIAHNLGSVPGCIMVKRTDTSSAWAVYHRSLANTQYLVLNTTAAAATGATWWNSTTPTSAVFSLGTDASVNASGGTYVAYIFAHDAGGFGLTETDNVISCGSFTTDGSGVATVNLGYEPQWVMYKPSSLANSWNIIDTMRGYPNGGNDPFLRANSSDAEYTVADLGHPTATGFYAQVDGNATCIYIAIRRGPMKVPTSGTSVFDTQLGVSSTTATISSGFVTDAALALSRPDGASGYGRNIYSRLQGNFVSMNTTKTDGEATATNSSTISFSQNNGIKLNGGSVYNANWVYEQFQRAPGFFDVVCYTGTGATQNVAHNLGVIPSFIVCKRRDGVANWCALAGKSNGTYESLYLNTTVGTLYTAPSAAVAGLTATTFNPQAVFPSEVNGSGETYVAYLFGTVAGVSKVGSYTGTATTLQVDCGFTAGSRFVLIKRTDSTGDWYVWDSARGIVAGNDPYLLLNSTAAEVTGTDYVDTYNAGFEISSTAPAGINASGGTFIFLAIA